MHLKISQPQLKNWLIAQAVVIIIYHGVMLITPFKAVELPITWFDRVIGYHKLFTYVYLSFFLLVFISIALTDEDISFRCSRAIMLNACISALVFFFFPTTMTLAYFNDSHDGNYFMMKIIRSFDKNYNCFPSIHIANSLVATIYFNKRRKRFGQIASVLWFLLIAWSVISTRQHYFIDIIGGIAVAVTSVMVINRTTTNAKLKWQKINNL
jgi:membrane-associated phospholipid phosphatase